MVSYCINVKGMSIPLILYAGPFPVWLAFFVVGMWLGSRTERNYELPPFVLLCIVGLLLCFLETKWLLGFHDKGYGLKLSAHVYSFAVIMILFSDRVREKINCVNVVFCFFEKVGLVSFGIYLTHLFVLSFLRCCGLDLGWLLNSVSVLLLTTSVIYFFKKIFPLNIMVYLGFK